MVLARPGVTSMANETTAPSQEDAGPLREVYALLAQANLLRMRGRWEEAVQSCMSALRLAPDSSSAQSLLGDIYENQGRFDDAVQWYRMALDANPDSPADKIKLNRLLQRQSPSSVSNPSGPISAIEPKYASLVSVQALRNHPEIVLRYVSLTAALFVAVIVVLAYSAVHHQAALSSLGLTSQEVQIKPVVVPPAGDPPPTLTTAITWRDSSEQALLDALRSSSTLIAEDITITDVQTDPRTQKITITVGLNSTEAPSRTKILRSSLHTTEAAAALIPATGDFSVRCLLLPKAEGATASGTLLFVGDIAQTVLPSSAVPEPSDEQVATLFTNIWWSPQITV